MILDQYGVIAGTDLAGRLYFLTGLHIATHPEALMVTLKNEGFQFERIELVSDLYPNADKSKMQFTVQAACIVLCGYNPINKN